MKYIMLLFDLVVGVMLVNHVVCCEQTYTFSQKKLKNYKYHLSEEIMHKVDIALMNMYFGKQMYTYEQMLVKREEENIRLQVKYTSEYKPESTDKKKKQVIEEEPIFNNNVSMDEIQKYYVDNMDIDDDIVVEEAPFNPVIDESSDIKLTDLVDTDNIVENENMHKSAKKKSSTIIVKSEKKSKRKEKKEKKIALKLAREKELSSKLQNSKESKEKKQYVSRKDIWKSPDIFLLDFLTMDKETLFSKYNITNDKLCSYIKNTAIKKAAELGVDISFYYEEISKRGQK